MSSRNGRSSLLSMLLAAVLAACSPSGHAGRRDTLRLAVTVEPSSLNPLLATTVDGSRLASLAFDPLLAVDERGRLQPALAAEVPTLANGGISHDGKRVTFHLRHGVRWQDGAPFTSADVAFTFAKVDDPAVNVGDRVGFDKIAKVATPDAWTVVATLTSAFAPILTDLSGYPIVPKHRLEHSADFNRDAFGQHPIGTGPYAFRHWDHGSRIAYDANPDYFLGAPKIAHLRVAVVPDDNTEAVELKTHELDEAQVDAAAYAQLHDASGLKFTREPRDSFTGYALNVTSPILRDVRVRRALSMAVDRVGLAAKNTYGTAEPAYADLERLFWAPDGEPRNPYAYDPAAAAALLDAAGWRRGPSGVRRKDGVDLRLRVIDFIGSATGSRVDLQVEEAMKTLGVASDLKYFNAGVYFAPAKNRGIVNSGDFDVAALTLTADADSQNDEIYTCAARSPNGYNVSRYCSPEMDALQREALTTLDPKKRASEVVEIERLAVTDVPYIFLYHSTGRIFTNADVLRTPGNVNSDWYGLAKWRFAPD